MDCESATYLHCTAEFAQLTRLVAADVRSTDRRAVNPAGDAQELDRGWVVEAPDYGGQRHAVRNVRHRRQPGRTFANLGAEVCI